MTLHLLSSGVLDPIGSDAGRPAIFAFLLFICMSLLWLFTLAAAEEDPPERLHLADRSLSPVRNGFVAAVEVLTEHIERAPRKLTEYARRHGVDNLPQPSTAER